MRIMTLNFTAMLACCLALSASVVQAQATANPPQRANDRPVSNDQLQTGQLNVGSLDKRTTGSTVRASELIGMNIQNDAGQSVGEIQDFVLDSNTGRVRYVAVTYGGFLGIGDKMFAVPYEAFKVRRDPDDPDDADDLVLVLDITQAQLEGAVGFDQDHWPDAADRNFMMELDRRYGVERQRRGIDVNVNRNGVDVDVRRDGTDIRRDGANVDVERN